MPEEVQVNIIKSDIPIIWIDTSIITIMTQWKYDLCDLDDVQKRRIGDLYNAIYENTRKGKLICPLAEQEAEIWIERDKWLDTIHTISLGIETLTLYDIQVNQFYSFMKAFLNNEYEITLNYTDAFDSDPVEELKDAIKDSIFLTVSSPILFGADYQRHLKNRLYQLMEEQRKENLKSNVSFQQQLEQEYIGELQALFILQNQFLTGKFKDDDDQFNATCGTINLNRQLMLWKSLTEKTLDYKGLIGFYKSDHHRAMPFTHLSCNLAANLMTDKQPIRSGDKMDIHHASTLMPYSNIFITDKAMSAFLRKRKFDEIYDTIVCYIGDTQLIEKFFSKL
jgi:hypothetical protein